MGTSSVEEAAAQVEDDGIDPIAWSKLKIAVTMTSHLQVKSTSTFLNVFGPTPRDTCLCEIRI
jgi:hypothetical protein